MATKDATITLIGAQTTLQIVQIALDAKTGNYLISSQGMTKDSGGRSVGLEASLEDTGSASDPHLDAIFARALSNLRKKNGLE